MRSDAGDIYAQRITADGTAIWTPNGVPVCTASGQQGNPHIVSDGQGGAFIAWDDKRNGNWDIFEQWIDSNGVAQLQGNGDTIYNATGSQSNSGMVLGGNGMPIIVWEDDRTAFNSDIYINGPTTNGTPICTAADMQTNPQIVPDGSGGAVIAWVDQRNSNRDIYAQRVNAFLTPQ